MFSILYLLLNIIEVLIQNQKYICLSTVLYLTSAMNQVCNYSKNAYIFLWGFIWSLKETPWNKRAFLLQNPSIWNHFWASSISLEYELRSSEISTRFTYIQTGADGCLCLWGGLVWIQGILCHAAGIFLGIGFLYFVQLQGHSKYSQRFSEST